MLAAPWLVYLLACGSRETPGKVELTADMIRIVFPYILFVSLVSLAGGVLNVYRRFAIPAFTPVLLNLSIIGAAIFLARVLRSADHGARMGRARSAASPQLALQIRPAVADRDAAAARASTGAIEGVRRVLAAMGPAVIGVSAAQISALINTQLAAALGDGRISWITYADRLMEFPSALLGVALGTVLLPSLAKHHADANRTSTRRCSTGACGSRSCWRCRRRVALWLLALPLVSTLYQYGRFTVNDAMQTRAALLGYSVGLLGLILVKILAPGFYARQIMRTPVKIAFVTVLVAQTLAVILMCGRIGHAGLTLSTSHRRVPQRVRCCSGSCASTGIYVPQPRVAAVPRASRLALCRARGVCSRGRAGPQRSGSARRRWAQDRAPGAGDRAPARSPTSARCGCWAFGWRDFNRRETRRHRAAARGSPACDVAAA